MRRHPQGVLEDAFGERAHDRELAAIAADRSGTITAWSTGAEEMFGFPESEAVGSPLDIIIPERLRERHWEGYRRVMASGRTRYADDATLAVPAMRSDGRRISIEFAIALLRDASGNSAGAGALIRDVTEQWERRRGEQREPASQNR